MLLLTTVNPTFNKGTLKKCWDLGWGVRGGRRCRKSWAYLRKNPDYAPAKAWNWTTGVLTKSPQLSPVRGRTFKEALIKNHSWRNEKAFRSFHQKKSDDSGKRSFCGYWTFPLYGNTMQRYEEQTFTTLFCTLKSDFMDVKRFEF